MRSRISTAVLAAVLLCTILCTAGCSPRVEKVLLGIGGESFTIEVARSEAQRQRGLMHRKSLGAREGMLFVFDRDQRLDFWMKNTTLPLSIAFLSREGKILEIVDMQPLSEKPVRSRLSARYALELAQGTFAEVGAVPGSFVRFPESFQ